tara:strand:- start:2804 stop:3385 length:582 start_codon:yes stop_codon:yes gene_type:complete
MKIKKLIKLLECIEGDYNGKLPQDMYHLGTYTKEGGTWEAIAEMDFVHAMRAFKRVINYDVNLEVSVSQTNQIMKLEQEVSHLRERVKNLNKQAHALQESNIQMKERNQDLHKRLEEKSYREVTAPRYVFSEIPNDCDGQRFVDDAKNYFNRSRYNMRVRGQHIKEEYKGTGATAYGQSIEQSTHLRVYIEEK